MDGTDELFPPVCHSQSTLYLPEINNMTNDGYKIILAIYIGVSLSNKANLNIYVLSLAVSRFNYSQSKSFVTENLRRIV